MNKPLEKPTPTPWAVSLAGDIVAPPHAHGCRCRIVVRSPLEEGGFTPQWEADSELIVKVVNERAELLGALKALIVTVAGNYSELTVERNLKRAREALAKAEGTNEYPICQCNHGAQHHNNADHCSFENSCSCKYYDPSEAAHVA